VGQFDAVTASLIPNSIAFPHDKMDASIEIPISSPTRWDSEHPNLYTLGAVLTVHKSTVEKFEKKIGFRKVEQKRNKLYVNGDAVKLRGVCRHDTHPLWGRRSSPEQDEKDAILLRDANVNFIRTSHYPPAESFLAACDRHGIYVEEESAVCFVQNVPGAGSPLTIPIKNWFNHTNLGELKIVWTVTGAAPSAAGLLPVGDISGEFKGMNLTPGAEGTITLPARNWKNGEFLNLKFFRSGALGLLTTTYTLRGQPKGMSEVGIAFTLSSSVNRLTWDRRALWSAYPSDHIGRPQGIAMRDPSGPAEIYRSLPRGPWSHDSKDFFLYGPNDAGGRGTNDFRSLKENIWHASCVQAGTDLRVRAESDATAAVRAEVLPDGKVRFHIDNLWGYPDLAWGGTTRSRSPSDRPTRIPCACA
jgi:hypothetical protein